MKLNWIVSQIGARQHFGVPRGFLYKDELRLLYTDAWCRTGRSWLRKGPAFLRSFAGRYHDDVPSSKVVSFNLGSMYDHLTNSVKSKDIAGEYLHYVAFGQWFTKQVARDLSRRKLNPEEDAFFGFNTGCLEVLDLLRDRGIISVVDQMDPARVEEQLVYEESERWPGWQKLPGRIPSAYWERMDAEWAAASLVLVNSDWSRKALVQQGVPDKKIIVIPPPYEPEKLRLPARRNMEQPITVLWLGLVNLRKGIQYLIQAARLLRHNSRIRFVIAGPIEISDQAVKDAPPNMQFLGRVPRIETGKLFREADVFVLPTISDGFAVSQLEAMSQALPVITTPNCGEVVTDGVDGLIVPAYDGPALAAAIEKLESDRQLLREMSYAALDKSAYFYLPRQAELLGEAIGSFRAGQEIDKKRLLVVPEDPAIRLVSSTPGSGPLDLRVAVIQDGARLHYAVPLALHRAGALRMMFSEVFFSRGSRTRVLNALAQKTPSKRMQAMLQRRSDGISPLLVRTNSLLAARQEWNRNRRGSEEAFYEWASTANGKWVNRRGIADANAIFGFIRNMDPAMCQTFRERGVLLVGDQMIAPAAVETAEAKIQKNRWPDWIDPTREPDYQIIQSVEERTWPLLHQITCGSDYVRQGLIGQGIEAARICVNPYPIDAAGYPGSAELVRPKNRPITVGFVGAVSLRKGAPYFLEVARRFKGSSVRFVMVGSVAVPKAASKLIGDSVELIGRVPRGQIAEWMLKFDLFLFPSTCEGAAGSVTEAMASGLPIISTPNSGTQIRDGIDGFIRDYSDIDGLTACVEKLASDASLRQQMGIASRKAAMGMTLESFGDKLIETLRSGFASR